MGLIRRALLSPHSYASVLNPHTSLLKCWSNNGSVSSEALLSQIDVGISRLKEEARSMLSQIRREIPTCVNVPCCALFKVSREAVRRRPRRIYEALDRFFNKVDAQKNFGDTPCHRPAQGFNPPVNQSINQSINQPTRAGVQPATLRT